MEHVRVTDDMEAASAGVIAAGLPEEFAEFLQTGGSPPALRRDGRLIAA